MVKLYGRVFLICATVLSISACGKGFNESPLADDPTTEQTTENIANEGDTAEKELEELTPPANNVSETEKALSKYDHLDPQRIVPSKALATAVAYFDRNQSKIANKNYIGVINFGQSSRQKRFYIVNMKTGAVTAIRTSHGKGSDSNHDGYAERFSNTSGSNASSLGFYTTAETYYGKHGLSLKLDGRSTTNSNARRRAVVIHGASYVREADVIQGRSWGCPAVSLGLRDKVIGMLKGGALLYAYK